MPGIIYGLYFHAGFPSSLIEWHGHNDFYKAVTNAGTAWLYGASAVNCSLLGIGERTMWRLVKSQAVPHIRIGRRVLFRREALAVWAESQEVR